MSQDEANDVRRRMQLLRSTLRTEAKQVAEDVRTVSDWKYYVRHHPWSSAAAVMMAGYFLIPKRAQVITPSPETIAKLVEKEELVIQRKPEVPKSAGIAATLLGLAFSSVSKAAMGYVQQMVQTGMARRSQPASPPPTATPYGSRRFPK